MLGDFLLQQAELLEDDAVGRGGVDDRRVQLGAQVDDLALDVLDRVLQLCDPQRGQFLVLGRVAAVHGVGHLRHHPQRALQDGDDLVEQIDTLLDNSYFFRGIVLLLVLSIVLFFFFFFVFLGSLLRRGERFLRLVEISLELVFGLFDGYYFLLEDDCKREAFTGSRGRSYLHEEPPVGHLVAEGELLELVDDLRDHSRRITKEKVVSKICQYSVMNGFTSESLCPCSGRISAFPPDERRAT